MKLQLLTFVFLLVTGNVSSDKLDPVRSRLIALLGSEKQDTRQLGDTKQDEVNHANQRMENPMDRFYAKNEEGRKTLLDNLFDMNADDFVSNEGDIVSPATEPENSQTVAQQQNDDRITNEIAEENSVFSLFKSLHFLPLVEAGKVPISPIKLENDKALMKYIDSIRGEAWSQFKSIVETYINTFDDKDQTLRNSLPMKLLRKTLDMADNVNIVHLLGKKLNPEIFGFIKKKFQPLANTLSVLGNSTEKLRNSSVTSSMNRIVNDVAWMSMRQIIDDILQRVNKTVTREELNNYVESLAKSNPFAAKGLHFVLNLPPANLSSSHLSPAEGRSYTYRSSSKSRDDSYKDSYSRDDYGYHDSHDYSHHDIHDYGYHDSHKGYGHKDVGYGGHSSHSNSYHKIQGIYLDPYLILAGIGATALLAYVAFRILTTTAAPAVIRRRRSENSYLADDEEVIDKVSFIQNSVEKLHQTYNSRHSFVEKIDGLVDDVNELWSQKQCQKCTFFQILKDKMADRNSVVLLLLSSFGHLLGLEKPGQFLDEMALQYATGQELVCEKRNNDCSLKK